MLKWLNKVFGGYIRRYFEREMGKRLDAGEYDTVLRVATRICRERENDVSAQHWRALALLRLEHYQEAFDIASRLERLKAEGVLNMSDSWVIAFEEVKCCACALDGLHQYDALHDYSSRCLKRHPGTVALAAYQLLAAVKLRELTASTACLRFLDGSIDNLDEPWHFFVLYSAHRDSGNKERAGEIAQLALARYPDDSAVQEMAKGKYLTPDSVSPCAPSAKKRCQRKPRDKRDRRAH